MIGEVDEDQQRPYSLRDHDFQVLDHVLSSQVWGPWTVFPWAWNLESGLTQTQTKGSIPEIQTNYIWVLSHTFYTQVK